MKSVCYHRLSVVYNIQDFFLSAYDSYTWRLCLVQTEGGIFKSTVDVTWLLPKAKSLQLTNSHCLANMSPWVIILPPYQDTAGVKKPWGLLGPERHAITLEMNTTTKCFTNPYFFLLTAEKGSRDGWGGERWKSIFAPEHVMFLFILVFNLSNLSCEFQDQ